MPSGSGSNGSVSKVEESYSASSRCSHRKLCCIKGERNPEAFHCRRYSLIRQAFAANCFLDVYSFPSCSKPCTPTSNPACVSISRTVLETRYSPSGTKLKHERNPLFRSRFTNCSTRDKPLQPSTS